MPYLGNVPSSFNVGTDNINNDAITTAKIADGAILNADVNAAAAIAGTKISPDFGSQNILTTGTATAASLIPTSSTVPTNGLYLPAANSVAISTGGSGRLFVNSSGQVGIGGTPSYPLDVNRGSAGIIANLTDGVAQTLRITTGSGFVALNNATSDAIAFQVGGTERMRLDSSGRLGIGTSSINAGTALHIARNTAGNISAIRLSGNDGAGDGGAGINFADNETVKWSIFTRRYSSNNRLYISTTENDTSNSKVTISEGGNVGIGTTNPSFSLHANGIVASESVGYYLQIQQSGTSSYINSTGSGGIIFRQDSGFTERARFDSSGNFCIGASGFVNGPKLGVKGNNNLASSQAVIPSSSCGLVISSTSGGSVDNGGALWFDHGDLFSGIAGSRVSTGNWGTDLRFYTHPDSTTNQFTLPERMRINSDGSIVGGSNISSTNLYSSPGFSLRCGSGSNFEGLSLSKTSTSWGTALYIHRSFSAGDGTLIEFAQDTVTEGTISVSGSTVSYNGGHLSRWSQTVNANQNTTLLKGTVMTNLDEMCEWFKEDGTLEENEQLNKMAVSSVEGDPNVAGVLVNIDDDGDLNVGMTGDMIIRIAAGVTVERGDLLMSAGDGTAKPQDDDIIRSKTIAKVTSSHVSCTYDDGSYCVPCVLMAC